MKRERARINWPAKTRQKIIQRKLTFRLNWSSKFTLRQKFDWGWYKFMALVVGLQACVLLCVLGLYLVHNVHHGYQPTPVLLWYLYFVVLALLFVEFNIAAARVKLPPRPKNLM